MKTVIMYFLLLLLLFVYPCTINSREVDWPQNHAESLRVLNTLKSQSTKIVYAELSDNRVVVTLIKGEDIASESLKNYIYKRLQTANANSIIIFFKKIENRETPFEIYYFHEDLLFWGNSDAAMKKKDVISLLQLP